MSYDEFVRRKNLEVRHAPMQPSGGFVGGGHEIEKIAVGGKQMRRPASNAEF